MRFARLAFVWVSIGFGYQIMAYGPDAWTSMAMVGHVLGWPVFFLAWLFSLVLHFGLWFIGLLFFVIAAIWAVDAVADWKRTRRRKAAMAARRGAP